MYKGNRFAGNGKFRPQGRFGGNKSGNSRGRFAPKQIDSRLFVRPAVEATAEEQKVEHSFNDFGLSQNLLSNIKFKGISVPTPIQDKALLPAMEGKDLIGLADTGTGKTIAFALPILQKLSVDPEANALILAPTRELAVQIRDEIRSLSIGLNIYSALLIGGSNMDRQIQELRRRPRIVIGTPGRIKDLHQRHVLRFDRTKIVVLDEMDRMLDMGFVKDITEILSMLPKTRQTLLFSATMDNRVEQIAMGFMISPVKISVKTGATAQNVDQNIIKVSGKGPKMNVLKDLLTQEIFEKVIVFGRTKFGVDDIEEGLIKSGIKAGAIHGNKKQSQRERVLKSFKNNEIKVLIATDVAARGIDVKDVTHVINFDQPGTYEDYVHRIGRTGRAGKKGYALTFVD